MFFMKRIVVLVCIGVVASGCPPHCKSDLKEPLALISPTDSVIYFDETPEFVKDSVYHPQLTFSNNIETIDGKLPFTLLLNDTIPYFKEHTCFHNSFTEEPVGDAFGVRKHGDIIQINYWDSLNVEVLNSNPLKTRVKPKVVQFTLYRYDYTCELRIPAGTFIDNAGRKNKAIHIMYKRKKLTQCYE
jgi:hypothetical protein